MEGKSVYRWISHNATTKEGVGIYIQYPNEEHQSEAMHTGLHCSSYKGKPSFMLDIPSSVTLVTTLKSYS
jgi:hypothetical protein